MKRPFLRLLPNSLTQTHPCTHGGGNCWHHPISTNSSNAPKILLSPCYKSSTHFSLLSSFIFEQLLCKNFSPAESQSVTVFILLYPPSRYSFHATVGRSVGNNIFGSQTVSLLPLCSSTAMGHYDNRTISRSRQTSSLESNRDCCSLYSCNILLLMSACLCARLPPTTRLFRRSGFGLVAVARVVAGSNPLTTVMWLFRKIGLELFFKCLQRWPVLHMVGFCDREGTGAKLETMSKIFRPDCLLL